MKGENQTKCRLGRFVTNKHTGIDTNQQPHSEIFRKFRGGKQMFCYIYIYIYIYNIIYIYIYIFKYINVSDTERSRERDREIDR